MQNKKNIQKTVALIALLALTVTFTQLMQLNFQKVKAQQLPDIQVSNEDSRESMIITSSDGNHIVFWGGTGYYSGGEKKIHAQKINGKTNQPMWGEGGVIVTGILNSSDFGSVKALPDNNGGAYILYKKDYNNNRSYHIYHIDTNGEPDDGWSTNLGEAEVNIDSDDFVAGVPEVIINNDGNVMVAYSYKYMYVNYIKVKIIDGETGDIINNSDPIDFVSGLEMQTIRLILNEDGSFFITYINGGNSVKEARKFNMDGSVGDEFEEPVVISPSGVDADYIIISDNNNGLYIIYTDNSLYITHLTEDGSIGNFNQEELYEPNVMFISSIQAIINSEGTIFITFIDDTSKFGIPVFHMIKIDSSGNIQDSVIHEKGIPDRYSKRYMVDNEDGGIYVIYAVNDSYDEEKWIVQLANIKRDGTKDVRYFGLETVYEDAWESNTLLNVSYKNGDGAINWLGKKEGSSYNYVYANAFTASSQSSGGNPCDGLNPDQQCGVLEITGTTDIFFEGYDPEGGGSIPSATFKQISSSATDQTTTLNLTSGQWTADQFVGVLDLEEGNSWSLQITGPTTFETSGGVKEFTPTTLKVATSVHEFSNNPLTVSDINSTSYLFAKYSNGDTEEQNLLYWTNVGSGYTFSEGNIEAPLNVESSANWNLESTFDKDINGQQAEDLLVNENDDGEVGIFGVGVNFLLGVPGNTTAGQYTGTITYTLL